MKNESFYLKLLLIGLVLCIVGPIWAHTEEFLARQKFERIILESTEISFLQESGSVMMGMFHGNRKGLWCCSIGASMIALSSYSLWRTQKIRMDELEKMFHSQSQP
jgi:hypothetical protein